MCDNMGATIILFSALLALCIITTGYGSSCRPSDISVSQTRTGAVVEGKPEYEVLVVNRCGCAQSQVIVGCYGLSSVESVDPTAIRPVDGQRCVVRSGRPIPRGAHVRFRYAWMTPQDFPMISSRIHC